MAISPRAFGLVLLALLTASPVMADEPDGQARRRCLGTDPDASVLIEVFSDYQCPACARLYLSTIRPVLADYAMKGKVCVVYREFPLQGRKYSRQAARYAEAASRLGQQQWIRVADALYYHQSLWTVTGHLDPVVSKALSDEEMGQVRELLDDRSLEEDINRHLALGRSRGVRATPTMFITANGKTERVVGAVQYEILRRYLDTLLARAQ